MRCSSCNKYRSVEELQVESAELEDISIEKDGEIYASLSASISVLCPECWDIIGSFEVSDIEVKLGKVGEKDIEPV